MIQRLRGRRRFAELAARGRRIRRGPLSVTVSLTDSSNPQIAFAIGRKLGPAVVRNRLRRRLRELIADTDRTTRAWPGGSYLFGASAAAAELSSADLRPHIEALSVAVAEVAS